MRTTRDVASKLRAVSNLRRLCSRLPHVSPPAEQRLLDRFAQLAVSPELATTADADALAVGWRRWWRDRRGRDIRSMASRIPRAIVEHDRRLATYVAAARETAAVADGRDVTRTT